jgi:uncharacterized protein (TIGR03435 family)
MCTFEYLANRMTFDGVTIGRLADELAGKVDRVVADGTAFTGAFYMDLQWSADGTSAETPSIFTALREQLGLKLEPERGAVDVVVIDRVERPAED